MLQYVPRNCEIKKSFYIIFFLSESTTTSPAPQAIEQAEPTADPNQPVDICTNEERLELLRSKCDPAQNSVNQLTSDQKGKMFFNIFVDPIHKLMACLPPKSGCTTWKNILANNSRDEPLPKDFNMMKLHYGSLNEYNIKPLTAYNDTMKAHIIEHYTKFLVSRHPLERFRSAYIDKLESGSDRFMQKQIGEPILNRFRPDLSSVKRADGRGVTIDLFTKYLKETHLYNAHWHPVHELCQPCIINYDYVLKTETLDHDNEHIILTYLKPYMRGLGTKGNIVAGGHQTSSLTPLGRDLEIYINSSIADMSYLEQMYKHDFEEFGYSWKYTAQDGKYSIRSSCVNGAKDRKCC